jgi:serine/threonine protein kinase
VYRSAEWSHCPRDGAPLTPFGVDPMVGQVLEDRYEIVGLVGEGAMGRVYVAQHTRLAARRFAVKMLFGDLSAQDNMRARFAREAETASRMEHPNVVSVVDFGETAGGLLFLVMEYLEGHGLDQLVRMQGALPQDRVVRLGRDIARGLAHAHARGLVHRDLKPENVVVVRDRELEVPKIVDFGVAIMTANPDGRVTRAGMVVGTPAFMSPEQATACDVDARSDLYALGMVLYYLAAGRPAFLGSAGEILQQVVQSAPPPIHAVTPGADVGPGLEAVISRLLQKHPIDRFQSAEEVIEALHGLQVDAGPTQRIPMNPAERSTLVTPAATESVRAAPPRAPSVATPPAPRRTPLWGAAAVALLILALTLGGLLWSRRPPSAPAFKAEALVELPEPTPPPPPREAPERPATPEARPPEPAPASPPPAPRGRPPTPATPVHRPVEPVAPPPVAPPPTPNPTPPTPAGPTQADLRELYTRLGARLETLDKSEAATRLRDRYFSTPFSAALGNDELRARVFESLRALERDVAEAQKASPTWK